MPSLQSLSRAGLQTRQRAVEQQLDAIVCTEEVDETMAAGARRLLAEWQAIESEWERRANLRGDNALADRALAWPSE